MSGGGAEMKASKGGWGGRGVVSDLLTMLKIIIAVSVAACLDTRYCLFQPHPGPGPGPLSALSRVKAPLPLEGQERVPRDPAPHAVHVRPPTCAAFAYTHNNNNYVVTIACGSPPVPQHHDRIGS